MLTGDDNNPSDWTVANLLEVIRKKWKEGKGKRPDDDDKTLGDIVQEKENMQTNIEDNVPPPEDPNDDDNEDESERKSKDEEDEDEEESVD